MTGKMKACPWCKSGGKLRQQPLGPVVCDECGAIGPALKIEVRLDRYEPFQRDMWNTRAPDPDAFRAGMLAAAGLAESSREAVIYSGERRYVEGVGHGHVRAANAIHAIANDPDALAALMKGGR